MSKADFEKAKKRLEKAKKEMHWAIRVFADSAQHLSNLELSQQELAELCELLQLDLEQMQRAVKRIPGKQTGKNIYRGIDFVGYESTSPKIVGEIPPFDDDDEY